MNTRFLVTILAAFFFAAPTSAQVPCQFRWQKGDTLTYKVKHLTNVAEVVNNGKTESISKLDIVKRWQVLEVDDKGVGTLALSIIAMRHEQTRPDGDTLLFDSQDLDKSTPELRKEMIKFIGKRLALVRVDRHGKVVETKEGSAARFEAEPPFVLVLPDAKMEAGQTWRRPYTLVLEPPQGTGEKYPVEQVYTCKQLAAGKALVTLVTEFKMPPDNMVDRLPLLQKDLQGEAIFDIQAGRATSIQLNIDKTIENHQGKGSSYRFQSRYSEVLAE